MQSEPLDTRDPQPNLTTDAKRFVEFCTSDVPRYQLLFQHTASRFHPVAGVLRAGGSGAGAHAAAARTKRRPRPRALDIWTALITGLVDQQISNDPGGDRWSRLVDDVVRMFLSYCSASTGSADQPRTPIDPATNPHSGGPHV